MAAIKKILQVLKKLAQISRLDKALQPKLVNPLAQEDEHIFRQQQIKVLARALEHSKTIGMKRSRENCGLAAQAFFHPRLQFRGSIVSECNGQNLFRPGVSLLNQPGNALHQHGGLAGSGASKHQHGPKSMLNGLFLSRIGSKSCHRK